MQNDPGQLRTQTQQDVPAVPELSSAKILYTIRKKPFTQLLHGVEYTYSILDKKQQNFLLTHERFLVLKGIQSISYAREFPQGRVLPFANAAQLPNFKASFPVSSIKSFTNEEERLIIQFSGKTEVKWEFVCPTKMCALEWRKKLDLAKNTLDDFQRSGFNKFEEYLENKRKEEAEKHSMFSEVKSLVGLVVGSEGSINGASINASRANEQSNSPAQSINTFPQMVNQASNSQENPKVPLQVSPVNNPPVVIQKEKPEDQSAQLSKEQMNVIGNNILVDMMKPFNNTSSNSQQVESSNKTGPYTGDNLNNKEFQYSQTSFKSDLPPKLQTSQITKVQNFILNSKFSPEASRLLVDNPMNQREKVSEELGRLRRDWLEELIGGEEEAELIIDFQKYSQKVAQIIINELSIPQQQRIFPAYSQSQEYAAYLLQDIQIEIYFYSEDHLISKNPRYKAAVLQFKNFDYLLGALKNQGILRVPFMVLFEHKGFLGMGKTRSPENAKLRNRELYDLIDRKDFEARTRISSSVLLNQNQCRIVAYEKRTTISKMVAQDRQIFFVEKLSQFLPTSEPAQGNRKLLRPEYVQDEELEDEVFRDPMCEVKGERIKGLIERKINHLVKILESGEDYFTTSKELSELIHFYGLNISHIGLVYKTVKQSWLKRILQAEIISRCAKNFFRLDIQNSVLATFDKVGKKQRQEEREKNRVISFLNILFGNTETTFRIWRNLNSASQSSYGINIWQNSFTDINVAYLLQAIQTNFKVVLADNIHQRRLFKSMNTFDPRDFVRFQFDSTIYDLEFTYIFDEIHSCLQETSVQSFQELCQILIHETSTHIPYLELLKNFSMHDKISEFLLNFISPEENPDLYRRIEAKRLPSRFAYESKLAEIKWYLKAGLHDMTTKPANFIEQHAKRWLGKVHPLFTRLNRIMAEYYSHFQPFFELALKHAYASLQMQLCLYEGDCEPLWKDYYLVAKINYSSGKPEEALKHLIKAKSLVRVENLIDFDVYGELCITLAKCYTATKDFRSSYSVAKQLYNLLREERDQKSLFYLLESLTIIKQLLEYNQQTDSYLKFIASDFSSIIGNFVEQPNTLKSVIKMVAFPSLKATLLKNGIHRSKIVNIIGEVSRIPQNQNSCLTYLRAKIIEGSFPKLFLECLRDIDAVIEQMDKNQMLQRWISYNKLANESLLQKVTNSQIYRGFEFLANLTALFNLFGEQAQRELFLMQR